MSASNSRLSGPAGPRRTTSVRAGAARPDAFDRSSYGAALNRGYGDAMGRGIELALTLVVVGGIGWLIDRAAGTYPLFTVVLSVLGFAGITAKLFLGYDLEMRKIDHDAVWNRSSAPAPTESSDAPADPDPAPGGAAGTVAP